MIIVIIVSLHRVYLSLSLYIYIYMYNYVIICNICVYIDIYSYMPVLLSEPSTVSRSGESYVLVVCGGLSNVADAAKQSL